MVSWYLEQDKPDSTVNRNINAVRKDAIISTITNMLQVSFNFFFIIAANYILINLFFLGLSRSHIGRCGGSMSKSNTG